MLRIAKSSIQGKGLFAECAVRARTKLGELTGERISTDEAHRRAKQRKRIAIVELNENEAIDASVRGGPFRFINHSCEANVFIRIAHGRVEFYAKRNIPRPFSGRHRCVGHSRVDQRRICFNTISAEKKFRFLWNDLTQICKKNFVFCRTELVRLSFCRRLERPPFGARQTTTLLPIRG